MYRYSRRANELDAYDKEEDTETDWEDDYGPMW